MQKACPVKHIIVNLFFGRSLTRFVCTLCCLLLTVSVPAQLCQGSLGDPIVNITFGAGANPGPPLSAATTSYQYIQADCPNDGFYAVRNSTSGCFGNTWHNLSADHTGDANGYFMLVNASIQPGAFYVDTVRGLCGSTTYEFAAWVMNVILPSACGGNPNQPNLTFIIEKTDGSLLQSYNTNSILSTPFPSWKQQGFFFTTPANVSNIVLRIVNNSPGGCGSDLALDDITFRPCGPQVRPSIVGETANTVNICNGTARTFGFTSAVSDFFMNPAYQWQQRFNSGPWTDIVGATTRTLTQSFSATATAGIYEYRLAVADMSNLGSTQCRVNSFPLTIGVYTTPVATATSNTPICTGRNLYLYAAGGTQYNWTGPNGFASVIDTPTILNVNPIQDGTYTVVVANPAGCSSTASVTISVKPTPLAAIANTDTAICFNNTVQLSASGGSSYQWAPAAGLSSPTISNPIVSPAISTNYRVIVSNPFACTDTAYVNVTVLPPVIANAGPDKTIIQNTPVTLEGKIQGQYQQYYWSPAAAFTNTQVLQPVVTPAADAMYVLTAESANGCGSFSDTVLVKVYKSIYIPSAFTPNGDGLNDTWNIPALNAFPDFELVVYNRYGQVVFTNRNVAKPWDGKYKAELLATGAYVYSINLRDVKINLKGTVMILR